MVTSRPSAIATGIVEWAATDPNRVAFVDVQNALTMEELDRAVSALAARLVDGADGRRDSRSEWLPLIVDRSVASPVAMHGAVRAGCAWATIESRLPMDVVAEMFARLGNPRRAVVARPEYAELLPGDVEAITISGHGASGCVPPQPIDHDAPGAVVFTSGTTGRPKGVILPWAMLDRRMALVASEGPPGGGATWREVYVQPFGFAPGIRAIALASIGCTLAIADPKAMSIDELLDWLDAQRLDVVGFPPSLSAAILRVVDGQPRLPSASVFRTGAEVWDWALVPPLRRLIGEQLTIRSGYATSEAGGVACFDIGPDDPVGTGRIPLGRLLPGVEVRLEPLDEDPSLAQLVVANPRSPGYLGDAELTARRFIVDDNGVRWWRSGDVVEVDDDGLYHHCGRADELVKIRGVFVAPSRLEQALRTIDGIGAACAVTVPTSLGKVLLVGHVRVDDDTLTPEAVESSLRERLPQYLMPSILVRHDELPRTDRDKVDRHALAATPLVRWRSKPARVPSPVLERWCLAEVRRIVGLDDIGPDDDLFEAGLDSLATLELCSVFSEVGFDDVDPSRLLEARTCARICASLSESPPHGSSAAVPMNRSGTRAPLFVLPGGGATALKFRLLAEFLGSDQPVVVIEPRGMHREDCVDRTVGAMADHAREEIEAWIAPDDVCLVAGFSASASVAYEAGLRMHAAGRTVRVLLLDAAPARPPKANAVAAIDELDLDDVRSREVTVLTATRRELPAAVQRSLRFRWLMLRVSWFERYPGRPRYDEARYRAFRRIIGKAGREYVPAPAVFPVTLLYVAGNEDAVARTEALVPNLAVKLVGGNHTTMIEMPEVVKLAADVAAWADGAIAATSAAQS